MRQLDSKNAKPDAVILESALAEVCKKLVPLIKDKSIRKSLTHYYKTRQKWPCSLCVAAWYLVRLGKLEYKKADLVSQKIISILPDRFETPEAKARNIIQATEFKESLDNIEIIFFESVFSGYSNPSSVILRA